METLQYTCKQNSPVWFASEEVVITEVPETIFVHDYHGNAEIHMRTKFHFHVLHGLEV